MSNEFINDGFLKFARPGYNMPEQRWHFNRFQSQQGKVEAMSKLSTDVSKGLNIPRSEALALILEAMPDADASTSAEESKVAMAKLAEWIDRLAEIANDIQVSKNEQGRDVATMMFVSRLPLDWVLARRENLESEYCVDLPPDKADFTDNVPTDAVNYARLAKLKRSRFLDSKDLWKVMRSITDMLPGSIIQEIVDYALNEYLNGEMAETAEPETPEEQVGKPEPESIPPSEALPD